MTTEDRQTQYCPGCGMHTTATPLLEPIVATTTVFDCMGFGREREIGLDAAACDVCGRRAVDDLAAGATFNAAQSKVLADSFERHAGGFAAAVQWELARYGRQAVCTAAASMCGAAWVLGWLAPRAMALALLPPVAVGGWALAFGLGRVRRVEAAGERWRTQTTAMLAREGRKGLG